MNAHLVFPLKIPTRAQLQPTEVYTTNSILLAAITGGFCIPPQVFRLSRLQCMGDVTSGGGVEGAEGGSIDMRTSVKYLFPYLGCVAVCVRFGTTRNRQTFFCPSQIKNCCSMCWPKTKPLVAQVRVRFLALLRFCLHTIQPLCAVCRVC